MRTPPRWRVAGPDPRKAGRTRTTCWCRRGNARSCPDLPPDPPPAERATGPRPRRPAPSPAGARFGGGGAQMASVARDPVQRIVPDQVVHGNPFPGNLHRVRADLGDPDRDLARALAYRLRLRLSPGLRPRPYRRFMAELHSRLGHRLQRGVRRAKP